MQAKKVHFTRVIETESFDLIYELVNKSVGIGILPHSAIEANKPSQIVGYHDKIVHLDEVCLIFRHELNKLAAIKAILYEAKNVMKD